VGPCCKILLNVKKPIGMKRDDSKAKFKTIPRHFPVLGCGRFFFTNRRASEYIRQAEISLSLSNELLRHVRRLHFIMNMSRKKLK
jgi:hypothetical protein